MLFSIISHNMNLKIGMLMKKKYLLHQIKMLSCHTESAPCFNKTDALSSQV